MYLKHTSARYVAANSNQVKKLKRILKMRQLFESLVNFREKQK